MPSGIYIRTKSVSAETRKKIGLAHKGKIASEETRRKLSISHIGQKPWNKNIPASEESKEKNRIAHLGKISSKKGKTYEEFYGIEKAQILKDKNSIAHKGQITWSKGLKMSDKYKEKLSKSHMGQVAWNKDKKLKPLSIEVRIKISKSHKKHIAYNYKGRTPLVRTIRTCFEYRQWRSDVFTRDDFTCQECGQKGGILNAHHKIKFVDIIEKNKILTLEEAQKCAELWNINNGQTLCEDCHKLTFNSGAFL